jgi:hypothetical protein
LFDAIEWGLTGQLRRLGGIDAKETEKRASLGIKPEVQLWFSDGAHISRTKTGSLLTNAAASGIEEWLTADAWRGLSGIADCLQLTHFLGQSARQLFVHLDGKERWGLLEGPAGLQSLWKVEQALGRKQTQQALERVGQELTQSARQATEDIAHIGRLQADLRVARELARAEAALSPEEILERCRRIADDLAVGFGIEASIATVGTSPTAEEVDAMLQGRKIDLEAAGVHLASERAQLASWVDLAEKYTVLLAKRAETEIAKDAVAAALHGDEVEAAKTAQHTADRQGSWQAAADQCGNLQKQRDAIGAESERLRQIVVLEDRRKTLEASQQALTVQTAQQEHAVRASQDALALLESLRERYAAALARTGTLAKLTVHAEALLKENILRQEAHAELALLPQTEERLNAELAALRLALAVQLEEANVLRGRKEAAVAASNAIAAGVAQIAAALRDEDCVCPVCCSMFDATGRLKALAAQQAKQSNQELAGLEAEIQRREEAIRCGQQEMGALTEQLDGLRASRSAFSAAIAAADLLESELRSDGLLAGLTLDAFMPALSKASTQCLEEIGNLAAALTTGPNEAAVRMDLQRLATEQRKTVAKQDECSAARAALESDLGLLRSWPSSGQTADELRVTAANLDLALVAAQQVVSSTQADLQEAQATQMVCAERVAARRSHLAQIESQLDEFGAAVTDLASRWNTQGYEDAPALEAIRMHDAGHERKQLWLHGMLMEHETLVQGRRHYLAHADLRRLEDDLVVYCRRHQSENVDALLASLRRAQDDATRQQKRLAIVKETREQLLIRIKKKATDIRSAVSAPLNANIEQFCTALMSDRTNQVSLSAIASDTSAQALLSFRPEGGSETGRNPLLYMSEGQLAAVSLCLLFGASTTYPWSRWKGLLLDDPLHHNDSVHAAAFIDVARNLISHQDYQIIVSTHDMDQAGYFLRKCSNAGIQTRYWHLYGRDEKGTGLIQSA